MPLSTSTCFLSAPGARCNNRLDPAPQVEVTDDLHPSRCCRGSKVIEYPVDRSLVEDPVVPEAPEIKLETLELEAELSRNVSDPDDPEIRRSTLELCELLGIRLYSAEWTERSELVAVHVYLVVAIRIRIRERLEKLRSWHSVLVRVVVPELPGHLLQQCLLFTGQTLHPVLRDFVEHHVEPLGCFSRLAPRTRKHSSSHSLGCDRIALRHYFIDSIGSLGPVTVAWNPPWYCAIRVFRLIRDRRNPAPEIVEATEGRYPQIDPSERQPAKMSEPADSGSTLRRRDAHRKIDQSEPHDQPARFHRQHAEHVHLFVGPSECVREQHSHHCS